MHRRSFLALLPAAGLAARPAAAWTGSARAQATPAVWPEHPVRIIVPVAAGGSQDIVARLLARHLTESLGQNVVVENQPGAGSNIGYEHAARSRPDGYTLLAGSDSLSINKALFPRLSFDPVADFAPVARAVRVPQILVVRADHPARDLDGFLRLARGGRAAVGTPGNGSLAHLLGEVVQEAAEARWTHVPYRAGRLRGLFVSSGGRTVALPAVPTLAEAGFSHAEAVGWHGLVAPASTDPAVVARVNEATARVLARPEVAERVAALGLEPVDEPPEALGALIRADAERWEAVVRRARIQPD